MTSIKKKQGVLWLEDLVPLLTDRPTMSLKVIGGNQTLIIIIGLMDMTRRPSTTTRETEDRTGIWEGVEGMTLIDREAESIQAIDMMTATEIRETELINTVGMDGTQTTLIIGEVVVWTGEIVEIVWNGRVDIKNQKVTTFLGTLIQGETLMRELKENSLVDIEIYQVETIIQMSIEKIQMTLDPLFLPYHRHQNH